jgi:hypothetical protein
VNMRIRIAALRASQRPKSGGYTSERYAHETRRTATRYTGIDAKRDDSVAAGRTGEDEAALGCREAGAG